MRQQTAQASLASGIGRELANMKQEKGGPMGFPTGNKHHPDHPVQGTPPPDLLISHQGLGLLSRPFTSLCPLLLALQLQQRNAVLTRLKHVIRFGRLRSRGLGMYYIGRQ